MRDDIKLKVGDILIAKVSVRMVNSHEVEYFILENKQYEVIKVTKDGFMFYIRSECSDSYACGMRYFNEYFKKLILQLNKQIKTL